MSVIVDKSSYALMYGFLFYYFLINFFSAIYVQQVWIYHRTANAAGTGVEQLHGVVQTPTGLERSSLLVAGSMSGCAR